MDIENKFLINVSVIIPVYNVYDWLDECLTSIVNQTFSDFEILLINDGSTDGSERKCEEWAKKDARIRYVTKENEGLSPTRNLGIQRARGEYLVFIDSDDWVDISFLEKLYDAIIKSNAPIAECDIFRVDNNTRKRTYRNCSGCMGLNYTLAEHMKYGNTAIWKCMIKKSLFIDNGIQFPDCHSPARSVYPLLLALGGKIVNVREGLYYYRRFRPNSLSEQPRVNNGDENAVGILAFDNLLQNFMNCGLYGKYEQLLQEIVKGKLSDILAGLFYRREKVEFQLLAKKYYSYIDEKFPGSLNFPYITLGGYNLNRILSSMNVLHNPYGRFNFSSIVSVMNPVCGIHCAHKNKYREIMIQRDIESLFWNISREINPKYLFMDFIEERFDIIEAAGGYITESDAFDEMKESFDGIRYIKRDSRECEELWKKSFTCFMKQLEENHLNCKVVIIRNMLSTKVGDIGIQSPFENVESILLINRILEGYYQFVEENYPNIKIIDPTGDKYYFTDKEYEYGAIPSHLNDLVNRRIAGKIEEQILGK